MAQPKLLTGRVIVDPSGDPPALVTAYRASRIEKYWRQE